MPAFNARRQICDQQEIFNCEKIHNQKNPDHPDCEKIHNSTSVQCA